MDKREKELKRETFLLTVALTRQKKGEPWGNNWSLTTKRRSLPQIQELKTIQDTWVTVRVTEDNGGNLETS